MCNINIWTGPHLRTKLRRAIVEMNKQVGQSQTFTSSLPQETVTQWELMVETWNRDRMKPNPYELVASSTYFSLMTLVHADLTSDADRTQADVCQELIEAERVAVLNGELPVHTTSASSFLAVGFEIEDTQYVLHEVSVLVCTEVFSQAPLDQGCQDTEGIADKRPDRKHSRALAIPSQTYSKLSFSTVRVVSGN